MNDDALHEHIAKILEDVEPAAPISANQRALRRAVAVNAVEMARNHAGRDMFSSADADIIHMIQELLEKVAQEP